MVCASRNQILDLSKYFSIKEISDGTVLSDSGTIIAITLRFRIFKVVETDADGTDYSLDIPVEIKIPSIGEQGSKGVQQP